MDTSQNDHNRSTDAPENREREEEREILDDELEAVVGGWNERDAAQQSSEADWVW